MTIKEFTIIVDMRGQFKEGTSKLSNRPCYGYIKQSDGNLAVHEPEAQMVCCIFERYLAGDSLGKIAVGLAAHGILSPTAKGKWNRQAIDKFLLPKV